MRFACFACAALLTALAACGSDDEPQPITEDGGASTPPGQGPSPIGDPDQPPLAVLELHPYDIWAQPLPPASSRLLVTAGGETRTLPVAETMSLPLGRAGDLLLRLESDAHHTAEIVVQFDGAQLRASHQAAPLEDPGLALGHEVRLVDGAPLPFHGLYMGLRHRWFASTGRPARHGNRIELLTTGAQAWTRVREAIEGARSDIKMSTWWWESDFELTRSSDLTLSEAARRPNTILGLLERSPATKRVMVGQFWGQDSILQFITSDAALKAHAEAADDGFEFMGQGNGTAGSYELLPASFVFGERLRERDPELTQAQSFDAEATQIGSMPAKQVDLTQWPVSYAIEAASYHQKFATFDHDLAFVGGMNLRYVDWDDEHHAVFNPLRMEFEDTPAERQAVAAKSSLPAAGPRKDYMLRVQGPAAQDVNDVFHVRWSHLLATGATYADRSSPFEVARDITPEAGGLQVQITATMPDPYPEHSIGESWFNAVRAAERFIFIEDQFFRMPMINETIERRMLEKPELRLVVITKPAGVRTDPGCAPSARTDAFFRSKFPQRYQLLQLRSFDTSIASFGIDETDAHFVDIDVHSKMLIVDDLFMSIGSANKNNRGMLYEAELNVAVLDHDWVRAQRRQILAHILPSGTPASDDVATWTSQLTRAANENQTVYARWETAGMDLDLNGAPVPDEYLPRGFVYPLTMPLESACWLTPMGDDVVGAPPVVNASR